MSGVPSRMNERSLSGRAAAALALREVLTGEGFVIDRIRTLRADGRLEPREAGLAMQVALGATRHIVTLNHALGAVARYDEQRTPAPLRAVLITAAYQMIYLDRVPVFAAVDEAVELARANVSPKAAGMSNAVLRNLARAIAERRCSWEPKRRDLVRVDWDNACRFNVPVLPDPDDPAGPAAHAAAATGERPLRFQQLAGRFGIEQAESVAWASQAVPVLVAQRNPLRADAESFAARIRAECGDEAEFNDDCAFLPASSALTDSAALREGLCFVQDATARAAARLVGALPCERVLDLCAAPGGKSMALAMSMDDRGLVLACDPTQTRVERIRENAERLGLKCVRPHRLVRPDAADALQHGPFDAALVDVPCSNTGVIARRPEARLGLTDIKLNSLLGLQASLLGQAAASVRVGGRLVYSTCSIEPEENQQLIAGFLRAQPHWIMSREEQTLPQWGRRLADWRDGGYAALLVRKR